MSPLPPRYNLFSTNVYVRPPPPHRIYPSLQEYAPLSTTICDPTRIYPSLSEYIHPPPFQQYPPFQQLYATLPESTLPSQNIPPFSTNVYLRPSKNLLVPPKIYPPPFDTYIRFFLVMLNNNLQTRQKPRSKISDI